MTEIEGVKYKFYMDISGACSACDEFVCGLWMEIGENGKPINNGEKLCKDHFNERAEIADTF